MSDLENWDNVQAEDIPTTAFDNAVKTLADAREDYDRKKIVSTEAHHHVENCKKALLELLEKAKKRSYKAEGIGTITRVDKLKVKFPKDHENKALFFKWLTQEMGGEGYLAYATVNYASLNSLFNQMVEDYAEKGKDFTMPGVGEPQSETELRFRKN